MHLFIHGVRCYGQGDSRQLTIVKLKAELFDQNIAVIADSVERTTGCAVIAVADCEATVVHPVRVKAAGIWS
ncbi:MAG: hypothetical protein WA459_15810 [Stellaceae bacterium]